MFPIAGIGQGYFVINEDIKQAYDYASTLRFELAQEKVDQIKKDDPENLLVYHVENYIDFFTLFISEDEEEYKRLEKNKNIRLAKINEGDKKSPYYLFSKAEINLQWATARLKFGERMTPAQEAYRAYKLLEKNHEKFPDFIANKKSLSIIHALGESLPGLVRTIIGVDGSIEQGTQEISEVVEFAEHNDFLFKEESYAIYAYILFYQNNKKEEAYDLLFNADLDHSVNPLICFLKATIAQKTGRNKEALQILEERPQGTDYFNFAYLEFMYGKYKLYELDADSKVHMDKFLSEFNGRHFIKEAYQKLAWYALATQEDIVSYKKYMELVQTEGHALVDEDKQALKESDSKDIPDINLLKARLLFDGGAFPQAYNLLVRKSYLYTKDNIHRLEFDYRMGRLCHKLKNYYEAVNYYNKTIFAGRDSDSFMSCNAALQIALILEEQAKFKQAKDFFNICLDISPKEYKSSLHQKAKSGKERVKNHIQ